MADTTPYSVKILFHTNAKDIVLLNSIIDSYEGLALIRTDDKKAKNFLLFTTDGLKDELLKLLDYLKNDGYQMDDFSIENTDDISFC